MTISILLAGLGALGAAFCVLLLRIAIRRRETRPTLESIGLGAVTSFFDTLGIGSFAPTTAWIRFRRLVPDSFIPATLNVGHALPAIAQSAIVLVLLGVHVDPLLLGSCIGAAVLGALMAFGIGLYAPSLILLSLLGLDPRLAFPIMASRRVDLRIVLGIAVGGVPAVLVASFMVKAMPIIWLRWGVVAVVVYAAVLLLRSAVQNKTAAMGGPA
ncbi:MAG TPA: hypothetical protein VFR29_08090 [Steroidobacteraceae bacterium]|nr:hypothetical protein [Steroidobacteraceae bacterium]